MIKVRRKYAESKAHVRLKYSKSTVKYGKSTVLYGNSFLAPTVEFLFLPLLLHLLNLAGATNDVTSFFYCFHSIDNCHCS